MKTMGGDKNYRGPDYACSGCGLTGHRLWRQTHTLLTHIELLCATCAEVSERENIAKSAAISGMSEPHDACIGYLVPARPTDEGDTFWGHTSGDVQWWYELPMYQDPAREMARLRVERDFFCKMQNYYAGEYLKALRDRDKERAARLPRKDP
jgi:hypothetical protein